MHGRARQGQCVDYAVALRRDRLVIPARSRGRIPLCNRGSTDGTVCWPEGAHGFFAAMSTTLELQVARSDSVLFAETATGVEYAVVSARTTIPQKGDAGSVAVAHNENVRTEEIQSPKRPYNPIHPRRRRRGNPRFRNLSAGRTTDRRRKGEAAYSDSTWKSTGARREARAQKM
jgi:hypothetical protein